MKNIIALSLALMMSFLLVSCKPAINNGDVSSLPDQTSLDITSTISEYPSSEQELSSKESSDLSSIVSKIQSSNAQSKAPAKKPASSSKPAPKPKPPASSKPTSSAPKVNNTDMKAVWISFLEFQSFQGSDETGFANKIKTYFDTCVNKGLNTVIVQVRPYGDSFYPSDYYPWSKFISGTMGNGVSYDPLKIMVEAAHTRGLSIHAWINPYRTMTDYEMSLVDDSFAVKKWYNSSNRWDYMVKIDGRWWLKPGNVEAQKLIINGAVEIVSKYNVDGIHMDDYFYGTSVSAYGDTASQAKANTTALVKGLYKGIKAADSSVLFGISPAGAFRENNSLPSSDMGYLSTDLKLWCQNKGYIDYIMPQVYWGYNHATQPYTMTLDKWQNFVTEGSVALYIGLAPYKIGAGLEKGEIERQIADITNSNRATGYCLFRYDHIGGLNFN